MKNASLLLIISLLLSGCTNLNTVLFGRPQSYYTDPNSPGYTEQVFHGLCEVCGRDFTYSKAQADEHTELTCPYDGQPNNLVQASNRYDYAVQQANAQHRAQVAARMANAFTALNQSQTQAIQRQSGFLQCVEQCNSMGNIYSPNPGGLAGHRVDCSTYCMNR